MQDFESLIGGRMEELESNITERERNFRHQMEETAEKVKDSQVTTSTSTLARRSGGRRQ